MPRFPSVKQCPACSRRSQTVIVCAALMSNRWQPKHETHSDWPRRCGWDRLGGWDWWDSVSVGVQLSWPSPFCPIIDNLSTERTQHASVAVRFYSPGYKICGHDCIVQYEWFWGPRACEKSGFMDVYCISICHCWRVWGAKFVIWLWYGNIIIIIIVIHKL